jgi:hypothetical protein
MEWVDEVCTRCLGQRVEFAPVYKPWDGQDEWVLQDCPACRGTGVRVR